MERRRFLALLGTPAYAELARRIGLQTAPDNSKADVNNSHLARRDGSRAAENDQDDRVQRLGSWPGVAFTRRPTRHGGGIQRNQNSGAGSLARLVCSFRGRWFRGRRDANGAAGRGAALFVRPASFGHPLVSQPRSCRPGSETRDLHRAIRIPLHRTERRAGPVRRGGLSGAARLGPLI